MGWGPAGWLAGAAGRGGPEKRDTTAVLLTTRSMITYLCCAVLCIVPGLALVGNSREHLD